MEENIELFFVCVRFPNLFLDDHAEHFQVHIRLLLSNEDKKKCKKLCLREGRRDTRERNEIFLVCQPIRSMYERTSPGTYYTYYFVYFLKRYFIPYLLSEAVRVTIHKSCLLYTSPSPRDRTRSRMPSSA